MGKQFAYIHFMIGSGFFAAGAGAGYPIGYVVATLWGR